MKRFCALPIILFVLALGLHAQTTSGSIAGDVVDSQQSAVPAAVVTITDQSRGTTQSATTDAQGRFVFPQLTPGTYKVSIEGKGFKRLERTGIELVANDHLALGTIPLEVGAATETITVTAEATLVQSETAERSFAVQGEILRSIAVNGRGFTPLASIVPGVIFNTNNGSGDAITNIFANGLRSSANNLTLDGVAIVDTGNNGTLLSLNLDSVAEFKVLTSNYQAEYGRSAGAQISAVTRGGTRDFHGSFYVFRRHDGMNANTWLNNRDSTSDQPYQQAAPRPARYRLHHRRTDLHPEEVQQRQAEAVLLLQPGAPEALHSAGLSHPRDGPNRARARRRLLQDRRQLRQSIPLHPRLHDRTCRAVPPTSRAASRTAACSAGSRPAACTASASTS